MRSDESFGPAARHRAASDSERIFPQDRFVGFSRSSPRKRCFWALGKAETLPGNFVTCRSPRDVAVASEIELKLDVPPHMLRLLSKAPWLRRMTQAPVQNKKLVSVYFDTDKRALREEGLSLRVRRSGDRYLQTVKGAGGLGRLEWEEEIEGAKPNRHLVRHTALKPFRGKKTWRRLRPVFETDIARTVIPVRSGGSLIEVALDRGKVKSGSQALAVSEVELELKDVRVADLNSLAARIAKSGTGLARPAGANASTRG